MLLVLVNGIDKTEYIERNSIKITDQLNDRANTCSFKTMTTSITEGQTVYIYDGSELTAQANSGQPTIYIDDTFEYFEKYRVGDTVILDIDGVNEKKYEILSISHTNKTITFTTNLSATLAVGVKVGRLIFGGNVTRNAESEFGFTGTFDYKVTCTDFTKLFDRKNVFETFEDQYSREIIGRSVYEFVANEDESTLDTFDAAWTEGGVGLAMADEATDKIEGNYSQKTGTSGAGTATWTKTITLQDLSSMDFVRIWFKIKEGFGNSVAGIKIRAGTDSSNYFEWDSFFFGYANEECWHYESFAFNDVDAETGSPSKATIAWLQIEVTCKSSIATGNLLFDHCLATQGGFTIKNTTRGDIIFSDVRVQHIKTTNLVEDLAKKQKLYWYIDYEKDLHFFKQNSASAPYEITDTSENFDNLIITPDISKIKNRQTVRGGEAPGNDLYTQIFIANGETDSWRLDYKPKSLTIETDTGGGYVSKTVGVENLVDESTVDYVYNFNEKVIRQANASLLSSGDKVRIIYYPFKKIRVRAKDSASIASMKALTGGDGIYDGAVITDTSILTFEDARIRANAEIEAYSNPIISVTFKTEKDGLKAGQLLHVVDTARSIDDYYLIQQVSMMSKNVDEFIYTVRASSTMFGIIEFFQLLLKKSGQLVIDSSEQVDILQDIDDTITISDAYTFTQKNTTVTAGDKINKYFDYVQQTGTITASGIFLKQWYGSFDGGETGSITIDKSAVYNDSNALKITTDTGGAGLEISARTRRRIPVNSSSEYTARIWLEIAAALTNLGTNGGFYFEIKEYAAAFGGSALATNQVTIEQTEAQDFNAKELTFTTNASTNYIDLVLRVNEAAGAVSIGEIHVMQTASDTESNPAIADFCEAT